MANAKKKATRQPFDSWHFMDNTIGPAERLRLFHEHMARVDDAVRLATLKKHGRAE